MGLIDRLLERKLEKMGVVPETKAAGFMAVELERYPSGRPDTDSIREYTNFIDAYKTLPWLYAGALAVAIALPKAKLRIYRDVGGEKVEVMGEDINDLLRRPNPYLSNRELLQITAINMQITGNHYWNLVGTGENTDISPTNPPVEVWWIKPEDIQVKLGGPDDFIKSYVYKGKTRDEKLLDPSEVIHFRLPNPDSYYLGLGALQPAKNSAILELNAVNYNKRFMKNDAIPAGLFNFPDKPTNEQIHQHRRAWEETHRGDGKAGKMGYTYGGIEFKELGKSPKDAQYIEMRRMNREEMLATLGVPPSVVGLLEYANYCLPAYARVGLSGGLHIQVGDLKQGMEILAYNEETGQVEPRKILNKWPAGTQQILEIKTGNRTIRASVGHKFLKLMPGINPSYPRAQSWVRADEISKGDYIAIQTNGIPGSRTVLPDGTPATHDLIEQLGLFLGDGNICRSGEHQNGLCMAIPKTDKNRDYYVDQMGRVWKQHLCLDKYTIRVCMRKAADLIINAGLDERASANKMLPPWIFELTNDLKASFLKGVINSDGHRDKSGRVKIGMKDKNIINGLRELCISIGWNVCNIYSWKGVTNFGPSELHSFIISKNGKQATDKFKHHRLCKELAWGKVRSAEGVGKDETFDIEVEGAHTFFAEGILTHNSNMEVQQKKFWEDAVMPLAGLIQDRLTLQLAPLFDDSYYLEFDYSDIKVLQVDEERKANVATMLVSHGIKTINEVRKDMYSLEDADGGDTLRIPISWVELGAATPAADTPPADEGKLLPAPPSPTPTEAKSFWADETRRRVLWDAFIKRTDRRIEQMEPAVLAYLKDQAKRLQKAVSEWGEIPDPAVVFDEVKETELYVEALWQLYIDIAKEGGEAGLRATEGKIYTPDTKGVFKDEDIPFELMPEFLEELRRIIVESGTQINMTTMQKVVDFIKEAALDDWTVEELTQAVFDKFHDELSVGKARVIANTEAAKVDNRGQLEGYKQSEFVDQKEWLSAFLPDTRETHAAANGQVRILDQPFNLGGALVMYPGDPAGGAENSCNCKCDTAPVVMKL